MEGKATTAGPVDYGRDMPVVDYQDLSDEELARRASAGADRASFTELIERYGPRLLAFLRRQTNHTQDAEDLVQDTFVKAYRNIDRYHSSYKFSTWLFTIARREATSHYRRLRRARAIAEAGPGPLRRTLRQGRTVADELAGARESLWAAAAGLSANQYQALWLKYSEDMSIKEIAQVMKKSRVSVKVLLYRARLKLAEKLRSRTAQGNQPRRGVASGRETVRRRGFAKVEGV